MLALLIDTTYNIIIMEHFADKPCEVIRRSSLALAIKKLKQISLLKGLKCMKKFNRSSNLDCISSSQTNRSYKPLEGYDTKNSNSFPHGIPLSSP
jgi:hypothetical protein